MSSVRPITFPLDIRKEQAVLGLFPYFGSDSTGGVELSGRLAWQSIQMAAEEPDTLNQLFLYRSSDKASTSLMGSDAVIATSRLEAICKAIFHRWRADVQLVWHVDLLKLLPVLRLPRARVILFLHGIEVWRRQDWLTQMLLRRVDCFLSNSQHTWQRFLDFQPWLMDKPHRVVHLGTGMPFDTSALPPIDPPTALVVGRIQRSEDYKGHREMIMAWHRVLEQIPDAQLWIAGKGDLRPDLEQMVQDCGLDEHVHIWGWISEEKKQQLLVQSRCFALPSRGEGFGLVYLEAMRVGRPCLVSTLDAGREVVNPPEAGLAVDPRDPQALADRVCRLLTPGPEWDLWSKQARQRYETHFTARHFQERLVSALFGLGS